MCSRIELDKQIQVFKECKWVDASIKEIGEMNNGKPYMIVLFGDFTEKTIDDIYESNADMWRYREKCCEQCIYHRVEGGDAISYGSDTCYLPNEYYCECPEVELEDPYKELKGGTACNHFVNSSDNTGINRAKVYTLCVENDWCTCCSCSQYNKLFNLIDQGIDLNTLALIISMFSVGVSKEDVAWKIKNSLK